jgi:cysteine-rich repeat protein
MKMYQKLFLTMFPLAMIGCPKPVCGDAEINQPSEECDDGNTTDTDGCTSACLNAFCGDGFTQAGVEQCDDGNIIDGDDCEADCTVPVCGNGIEDQDEECDDGNTTNNDGCSSVCLDEVCGDGVVQDDEECDDGNDNSNTTPNACREDCTDPRCGDGVPDQNEGCDDGNNIQSDDCKSDCAPNICGDGVLKTSGANQEGCDDGNQIDTDDCRNTCVPADCGDGVVQASNGEECDDSNNNNNDACTNACLSAECGDNITFNQGGGTEQCDDGNASNTDACLNTCLDASCGDGFTQSGVEQCDDGNTINTDDCVIDVASNQICEIAICGDGFVQANSAEQCDDGNATNGDGCENDCTLPECGNGIVDVGEVCFDDSTNVSLTVGVQVASVNLADFDLDGDLDILSNPCCNNINYSILSNSGNGLTYSLRTFNEGFFFGNMTSGDVNNDGKVDVFGAITNGNNGGVVVRINDTQNGVLAFTPPPSNVSGYPVGAPQDTRIGDINGDSFGDLVSMGDGIFFAVLGNGNGSFQGLRSFAVGNGTPEIADLDNDGIDDMIVSEFATQRLTIIFFNSSGNPANTVSFQLGQRGISSVVGDFDGDGDLDVAVGSNSEVAGSVGRVGVARNLGNRQFAAPLLFNATDTVFKLAAGDVNNDGDLDLLIEGNGGARLAIGDGNLGFTLANTFSTGAGAGRLVAFADLNGDGAKDIALAAFSGFVRIFFATP